MSVRKLLLGIVLTAFTASNAFAIATEKWSGAYGGLQAGWISIDNEYSHPDSHHSDFNIEADGVLIGALAGINWRSGNFLFGIEGDIAFSGADGERNSSPDHITEVDWFGTVRGRAGLLVDRNVLVYATAGLAVMDSDFEHVGRHQWSQTFVGWTAGGGIEFSTKDGIRFGLEALYVDFGSESDTHLHNPQDGGTHTLENDPSGIIGRAKIIVPIN